MEVLEETYIEYQGYDPFPTLFEENVTVEDAPTNIEADVVVTFSSDIGSQSYKLSIRILQSYGYAITIVPQDGRISEKTITANTNGHSIYEAKVLGAIIKSAYSQNTSDEDTQI